MPIQKYPSQNQIINLNPFPFIKKSKKSYLNILKLLPYIYNFSTTMENSIKAN